MAEPRNGISDEYLVELAADRVPLNGRDVAAIADELLARRRKMRFDNREAEEVRRLRWAVENVLSKVEKIEQKHAERTAAEEHEGEPT